MLARTSLENIVTLFACLSYSTDFATISINSNELFRANNITCQSEFLNMLTTRMQNVINHNRQLTQEMFKLKAEITALKENTFSNNNESEKLPTNCVQQRSGVVTVKIDAVSEPFNVMCEQGLNGGSWLLIAHRYNGSVDFNRNWSEYRRGFGNITGEFFIGLDKLYAFLQETLQQLLIILEDERNVRRYAHYSNFKIASVEEDFKLLSVGEYSGNAGDALKFHDDLTFSTQDHHQELAPYAESCAKFSLGAWWYSDDAPIGAPCYESNLFSLYQSNADANIGQRMRWKGFNADNVTHRIKLMKMFIRPAFIRHNMS